MSSVGDNVAWAGLIAEWEAMGPMTTEQENQYWSQGHDWFPETTTMDRCEHCGIIAHKVIEDGETVDFWLQSPDQSEDLEGLPDCSHIARLAWEVKKNDRRRSRP